MGLWCFSDVADKKCMARLAGSSLRVGSTKEVFLPSELVANSSRRRLSGAILIGVALILPHSSVAALVTREHEGDETMRFGLKS
jgi:hypothetical protein